MLASSEQFNETERPVASTHMPKLTSELLLSYSEAALRNADELLSEASLLLDREHVSRAYFLAVACIEEAGKALIAFDGQNRNLSDPAVCTKLKSTMESHSHKINQALGIWAMNGSDPRKALAVAVDLIVDLQRGREPSMYTELRTEPDRVQTPREIVRASAASDCVRLARECLSHAHQHVREKAPATFTAAHDQLFTMKPGKYRRVLNSEDFWWYYIARMEAGQQDMAEAVLGYEQEYGKTGTQFRAAEQASQSEARGD
jgi:AbiV family abortive infection protein